MGTLAEDLTSIKNVEDTLIANKVARFSYTDTAYTNNDANGVDTYDFNHEQNIPNPNTSILKVNSTVLDKGYRSQASSITRMLVNHFFGRVSYNLNKINDNMSALIATLRSHSGTANGFATLDSNGRIPYSQLPESAIELKGYWNASTNTPTLADGTGTNGDEYIVDTAGTQDLGSGSQYFGVGDRVLYTGGVWKNISSGFIRTINNQSPNAQGERSVVLGDHQPITKKIYNVWFKNQFRKWKDLSIPSGLQVFDVIYEKGIYVACVAQTSFTVSATQYGILWSEDGINWTPVSGDISSYPIVVIKFENNMFIAGGSVSGGTVVTNLWWSEDGKNWTPATLANPDTFSGIQIGLGQVSSYVPSPMSPEEKKYPNGLIFYDTNTNLWLAYCRVHQPSGYYFCLFWSEDGKEWSKADLNSESQTPNDFYFDYVHGRFFIKVGSIRTSDDGKYFGQAISGVGASTQLRFFYLNGYYLVGDGTGIARSQDGWTFVHDTNAPSLATKIVYADTDGLLAVNWDSDNSVGGVIWSTDGVNWSEATVIAKTMATVNSVGNAKAEKINGVYVIYFSSPSGEKLGAIYSFNLAFWLPCNYNVPQGFSINGFQYIQKEDNIIFQQVRITGDSETPRNYYLLYASYDGINFEPIYRFSQSSRGISKANNKLFYSPNVSQFCMSDPDTPITEDWEDLGDTPIV